ncbi:glycoside hydrolase family 3 C-terminal domain-containing protein [Phaeovulum sp. W22_SRMD_FR3]|uniref:glycoside hydrolase family 3 C-terminal domain-containing protein n=1 Tax=Phaeovulum sp. W22_SRMD_FR3 TaxID=3240274 RepID=UPI003F945336
MDTIWIEDSLSRMTLAEKVSLLAGTIFWETVAIERLAVPSVKGTDGPNGARGGVTENGPTVAVFPCGIALGATWNPALVRGLGQALAQETRTKDAHVLLAPTVNMHRGPLNGTHTSAHTWLPHDLLKQEYGFDGVVESGRTAVRSIADSMNAGLDLEMPGSALYRGQKLLAAIARGEIDLEMVTDGARRLLGRVDRSGVRKAAPRGAERSIDRPAHRALIRLAVADGTVLLQNDGLLPRKPDQRKIAVIGPKASVGQIMGGGSARVNAQYRVTPLAGLRARDGLQVPYAEGCANYLLMPVVPGATPSTFYNSPGFSGPVVHEKDYAQSSAKWFGSYEPGIALDVYPVRSTFPVTPEAGGRYTVGLVNAGLARLFVDDALLIDGWGGWVPTGDTCYDFGGPERCAEITLEAGRTYRCRVDWKSTTGVTDGIQAFRVGLALPLGEAGIFAAEQAAAAADVAVLFVGRTPEWGSEGCDLPGIDLPREQGVLIAPVAAANPRTVVVLQTGGPVVVPRRDKVAAILQAFYPGQEPGDGIADVLMGDTEPGGLLPQTVPATLDATPTVGHSTGTGVHVAYAEGIFIGYRHYDRPVQELRGFAALQLEPGAQETARVTLGMRDFAYFDAQRNVWRVPAGIYRVLVGTSAAETPRGLTLTLAGGWEQACAAQASASAHAPHAGQRGAPLHAKASHITRSQPSDAVAAGTDRAGRSAQGRTPSACLSCGDECRSAGPGGRGCSRARQGRSRRSAGLLARWRPGPVFRGVGAPCRLITGWRRRLILHSEMTLPLYKTPSGGGHAERRAR